MYRDGHMRTDLTPPRRWAGSETALRFVRALGFPDEFAGAPAGARPPFIEVDGPVHLGPLHDFQEEIAGKIAEFLRESPPGRGLISLPTGAGKTRVVTETLTRSFMEGALDECVLWLADREELCEQAVQSWREVWEDQRTRRTAEDQPALGQHERSRRGRPGEEPRRGRHVPVARPARRTDEV